MYFFQNELRQGMAMLWDKAQSGMYLFLIAAFMIVMSLAGCVSMGREFPSGMVSEIRIGQTTQAEVQQLFGMPWRVGVQDGQRVWTYGRYRYSLVEAVVPSLTEDLVLRFDERGLVSAYTYNSSADRRL